MGIDFRGHSVRRPSPRRAHPHSVTAPGRSEAHRGAGRDGACADHEATAGRNTGQGACARLAVAADARQGRLFLGQRDRRRRKHLEELCQPDPATRATGTRHRRRNLRGNDGSGHAAGEARATASRDLGRAAPRSLFVALKPREALTRNERTYYIRRSDFGCNSAHDLP